MPYNAHNMPGPGDPETWGPVGFGNGPRRDDTRRGCSKQPTRKVAKRMRRFENEKKYIL